MKPAANYPCVTATENVSRPSATLALKHPPRQDGKKTQQKSKRNRSESLTTVRSATEDNHGEISRRRSRRVRARQRREGRTTGKGSRGGLSRPPRSPGRPFRRPVPLVEGRGPLPVLLRPSSAAAPTRPRHVYMLPLPRAAVMD